MATQVNPTVEAPKTETTPAPDVVAPEAATASKDANQKAQEETISNAIKED